jgi:aminopeptidase
MSATYTDTAIQTAADNLRGILELAIEHTADRSALVVWDAQSELARALAEAYRRCLPEAAFIEFDSVEPEVVRTAFEELAAGDLVVLIQSTSFRLDAFRIRLELFKRSLKVVEHPHLFRMQGAEGLVYIDSLAYDRDYYRGVGRALQARLDRAQVGVIDSGGEQLVYPAAFEPAKVNIGDYTGMQNVGGQYPIGEVFTESRDLEAVHGRVRISFFGDTAFTVNRPDHPITLEIEGGRVAGAVDSTPEFDRVLANIRDAEGVVWLRELGFGMNRAFTQERTVSDIGTFERMCGVHLSLGAKHATYNKPGIRKKSARHHVDVFVITERVLLDDEVIYRDGAWLPGGPTAGDNQGANETP